MKKIIIQVVTLVLLQYTYAQPGSLDPTFGIGGKVVTTVIPAGQILAMDIQPDGRIVVAGSSDRGSNSDFALARYNFNGSLDPTFNGSGFVITPFGLYDDIINAVKIQSDGKIVVAGSTDNYSRNSDKHVLNFALARYNADGSLDNSFGNNGKVITAIGSTNLALAIEIQQDGKIVVAGRSSTDFALARYTSTGMPDLTFGNDGIVVTSYTMVGFGSGGASGLAIQNDGKIIAAGSGNGSNDNSDFAMGRYNTNGTLDPTFNSNGKVFTDFGQTEIARSIVLQDNGKIILGGGRVSLGRFETLVARYNMDGSLDASFNGGAAFPQFSPTSDFIAGVAVQGDGKVILAGYALQPNSVNDYDFAMIRYTENGQPDSTFGNAGKVFTAIIPNERNEHASAIKIFSNRIYVAGYSNNNFCIAAYVKDNVPLPLTLLNFSVDLSNMSVLCRWQTAGEINTSHFIVQRSYDGINFGNIGRVHADGNTSNTYYFTDDLAAVTRTSSTVYYRLQMTDKDGTTSYSSVASVKTRQSSFAISPNPAHDFIRIKGKGLQQVTLFDAHGKLVLLNNTASNESNTISLANLKAGVYLMKLQSKQGNVQTETLIIQ